MDAVETLISERRMAVGKLRPVGSRVPKCVKRIHGRPELDWDTRYHTECSASGTDALSMAVAVSMAGRPADSTPEVLLPAYGCPDLVAAIIAQGAKPILVDLVPDSPYMDLEHAERAITSATVALIGVGLLGVPERLDRLSELCRRKGLFLIEDSAQCFPPASTEGGWADFIVLSFGRGKPINLMGGGALLVRRDLLDRAQPVLEKFPIIGFGSGLKWAFRRCLFNFLLHRIPYRVLEKLPGLKLGETRFRSLQQTQRLALPQEVLSSGVAHFSCRPPTHSGYVSELAELSKFGWRSLDGTTSPSGANRLPRNRFGLLAPSGHLRDLVENALNDAGIGASGFYRQILPEVDGLEALFSNTDYPNARNFADRLLTLPSHEDVTEADVTRINKILRALSQE